MLRSLALCLMFALAGARAAAADPPAWIGSWGAAPHAAGTADGYAGKTLRETVRLSAGGSQLRLRLSNEFGAAPLALGAVHVALAGPDGATLPGSDRAVTFSGAGSALIPPGAPLISDPVDLRTPPLARLVVSLYVTAAAGPCTCHLVGLETGFLSDRGDFTGAPALPALSSFTVRPFLTGVDVRADAGGRTIVALGDSLTDGVGSTRDADRRWPDRLAERLAGLISGHGAWGVVNAGIGGNQLIGERVGPSALARLDRDVLAAPGVAYVIVFEGVNDLGFEPAAPPSAPTVPGPSLPAPSPMAAALIAGYRQIIERAHLHGVKALGATLTPYEGAFYYTAQGEADRQAVNAWIRGSGAFDGVIDFDQAWRDPGRPTQMLPPFQAGDHLHGDDDAYRALGDAIDLRLFR